MNYRNKPFTPTRFLIATTLLASAPLASWAGMSSTGSISFVPAAADGASAVPTLGGAMLILLAMLLAFIAFNSLRQQRAKVMLAMALAGGSLVSAMGGVTLIERANAGGSNLVTISNAQGQNFPIQPLVLNSYSNNAGIPMRVQNVTLPPGCPNGPTPNICTVGLELAQGDECRISCEAVALSDRRLKTDVVEVGTTHSGLPLYEFRYLTGQQRYQGVMAQDVLAYMPAAVVPVNNGYLGVNYQMLGLQMAPVE